MARARNIKPGFFSNDILAECDPLARIFFAGLWGQSDRQGRVEDRPTRLKAQILPYDNCDPDDLLNQLATRNFILRYEINGVRYIQVLEFKKHQNPHIKEPESTIPAPCINDSSINNKSESSDIKPEVARLNPESINPITDTGLLIPESTPTALDSLANQFEKTWLAYPERPGASKKDSLKAWKARIKAGATAEEIHAGVLRYAEYVIAKQSEPEYIKQPATFFGPGDHYKSKWIIPHPHGSPSLSQLGKAGQETAAAAQRLIEKWEAENEQEDRL